MQKDLYLIRGAQGSGKTTLCTSLVREGDVMVSNDDFMVNESGEYAFDWKRLAEVGEASQSRVREAMEQGVSRIFVHNTFRQQEDLDRYLKIAEQFDYRVFTLIVENRHGGQSVHAVPEKTIEKFRKTIDIQL